MRFLWLFGAAAVHMSWQSACLGTVSCPVYFHPSSLFSYTRQHAYCILTCTVNFLCLVLCWGQFHVCFMCSISMSVDVLAVGSFHVRANKFQNNLGCLRRKTSINSDERQKLNLQPGKNDFKKTTRELWDFLHRN